MENKKPIKTENNAHHSQLSHFLHMLTFFECISHKFIKVFLFPNIYPPLILDSFVKNPEHLVQLSEDHLGIFDMYSISYLISEKKNVVLNCLATNKNRILTITHFNSNYNFKIK